MKRWLALLLLAGCQQPITELVVVVDTDYAVPGGIEDVEIVVTDPDTSSSMVLADLATTPLPVSLGVVHRGGALGPVTIEVRGRRDGTTRVRRRVITSFVAGESRELRVDLLQVCEADPCGADRTCSAGACVALEVPASSLPSFTGVVTRSDAGLALDAWLEDAAPTNDAGTDACMGTPGTPEVCDGLDQNCNGIIDEDACTCSVECMLDHATSTCVFGGTCAIISCETLHADCDGMPSTGCERPTNTLTDCGGCDRGCASSDGTTSCTDGVCRITSCSTSNLADCNGDVGDGCEVNTRSDVLHCGRCGNPCPSGMRCSNAVCR